MDQPNFSADALTNFPVSKAIFEHPKITNLVETYKDNTLRLPLLFDALGDELCQIAPCYTSGLAPNNPRHPLQSLDDGYANCLALAVMHFAVTKQLPFLRSALLVKQNHVFNACYEPEKRRIAVIENKSVSGLGIPRSCVYSKHIKTLSTTKAPHVHNVVGNLLAQEQKSNTGRFTFYQGFDGEDTLVDVPPEHSRHHIMSVRMGTAALRFIERLPLPEGVLVQTASA